MGTTYEDVAHDRYIADLHNRPRRRVRTHEDSSHVDRAVTAWLAKHGANVIRVHPQELLAGKTPIGMRVRIRMQAARTPIESSLNDVARREQTHPQVRGYPLALALPDLPRLRREAESVLAALPPQRTLTWIFVGRYGQIDVVAPPRHEDEAAPDLEPTDQSSTRSDTTP